VRIPLLIAGPGIPAGVRNDIASLVDVLPTAVALFDVAPGLARGRDLLQAGAAQRERSALLATFRSASLAPAVGVVKGGFKYLRGQGETPRERLFGLPDEERDLGAQETPARLALGIELDARLGHLPLAFTAEPQQLSPDDRNALRSLGYLE
jgi:arylsulfatase A-like enzyme